jgi:hypothetical protein
LFVRRLLQLVGKADRQVLRREYRCSSGRHYLYYTASRVGGSITTKNGQNDSQPDQKRGRKIERSSELTKMGAINTENENMQNKIKAAVYIAAASVLAANNRKITSIKIVSEP